MFCILCKILAWLMAGIFLFPTATAQPLEAQPSIALTAPSYILMETGTQAVIFEKNATDQRQAASLIKLTSILLFIEALENGLVTAETPVTVSKYAAATPGSTALLDANSTYRFEDLLRSCIIASANDATVALAECIAGTEEAFVARMNEKAAALSLQNTHYVNCTGLSADGQYTSAYDVALVASALSDHPAYFEYSSLWLSTLVHPSGRVTDLTNTNRLVRFYSGCDGMKTGSSPEAKYCICATAKKDDMRLIAVLLGGSGSQIRFDEAKAMLSYGLSTYKRTAVIQRGELTGYRVPVLRGSRDEADVAAGKGLSLLLKDGQERLLSVQLSLPESITAPMKKDEPIGSIHVMLNDQQIASLPAVLATDVRLPGFIEGFIRILEQWR